MTSQLTSEDAVNAVGNRFDLVLIASQRVRELNHGSAPRVSPGRSNITTALLEIEARKYTKKDYLNKLTPLKKKGHRDEYYPS
jgi:DNA-directed RNA polymerase subunit omega